MFSFEANSPSSALIRLRISTSMAALCSTACWSLSSNVSSRLDIVSLSCTFSAWRSLTFSCRGLPLLGECIASLTCCSSFSICSIYSEASNVVLRKYTPCFFRPLTCGARGDLREAGLRRLFPDISLSFTMSRSASVEGTFTGEGCVLNASWQHVLGVLAAGEVSTSRGSGWSSAIGISDGFCECRLRVELEISCRTCSVADERSPLRGLWVDAFWGGVFSWSRKGKASDCAMSGAWKNLDVFTPSRCDETLGPRNPIFLSCSRRFCRLNGASQRCVDKFELLRCDVGGLRPSLREESEGGWPCARSMVRGMSLSAAVRSQQIPPASLRHICQYFLLARRCGV